MTEASSTAALCAFAAARRYSGDTLNRCARLNGEDSGALLGLLQELRPSENQLRDLWNWIEEIASRDHISLAHVLASEKVAAARRRDLGRNDKLKLLKDTLRRQRFPQLAAAEDQLAGLIRELALPRHVRVTLPAFLEGDAVHVDITADTAAALRTAAEALHAAAASPACERLFALLAFEEREPDA